MGVPLVQTWGIYFLDPPGGLGLLLGISQAMLGVVLGSIKFGHAPTIASFEKGEYQGLIDIHIISVLQVLICGLYNFWMPGPGVPHAAYFRPWPKERYDSHGV